MDNGYSGHSLVSDVTPWWWTKHWDDGEPGVEQALNVISAMRGAEVEQIALSRDALKVTFGISESSAADAVQQHAEELKLFLSELVTPEPVPVEVLS